MTNSSNFCIQIERIVNKYNINIMDAVIHYCEKNQMEIETAGALLNRNKKMMELLEIEAKESRLLKDNTMYAKLPI